MSWPKSQPRERLDYDLIEWYEFHDVNVQPGYVTNASYRGDQPCTEKWTRVGKKVGSGFFGTVWLEECESLNGPSRVRAIKEVRADENDIYKSEIATLARFSRYRHRFVNFYGWYVHDDSAFLAQEYFSLGDLGQYTSASMPENQAALITKQILQGVQVLHKGNVIRRDLKPKNVLVAQTAPHWLVKIGDFGTAKRLQSEDSLNATRVGTEAYQAPELHLFNGSEHPTKSVDLWSTGCIAFELLSASKPFDGDLRKLKDYCEGKQQFPTSKLSRKFLVSRVATSLVKSLLAIHPVDRPTADLALEAEWFHVPQIPQIALVGNELQEPPPHQTGATQIDEGFPGLFLKKDRRQVERVAPDKAVENHFAKLDSFRKPFETPFKNENESSKATARQQTLQQSEPGQIFKFRAGMAERGSADVKRRTVQVEYKPPNLAPQVLSTGRPTARPQLTKTSQEVYIDKVIARPPSTYPRPRIPPQGDPTSEWVIGNRTRYTPPDRISQRGSTDEVSSRPRVSHPPTPPPSVFPEEEPADKLIAGPRSIYISKSNHTPYRSALLEEHLPKTSKSSRQSNVATWGRSTVQVDSDYSVSPVTHSEPSRTELSARTKSSHRHEERRLGATAGRVGTGQSMTASERGERLPESVSTDPALRTPESERPSESVSSDLARGPPGSQHTSPAFSSSLSDQLLEPEIGSPSSLAGRLRRAFRKFAANEQARIERDREQRKIMWEKFMPFLKLFKPEARRRSTPSKTNDYRERSPSSDTHGALQALRGRPQPTERRRSKPRKWALSSRTSLDEPEVEEPSELRNAYSSQRMDAESLGEAAAVPTPRPAQDSSDRRRKRRTARRPHLPAPTDPAPPDPAPQIYVPYKEPSQGDDPWGGLPYSSLPRRRTSFDRRRKPSGPRPRTDDPD